MKSIIVLITLLSLGLVSCKSNERNNASVNSTDDNITEVGNQSPQDNSDSNFQPVSASTLATNAPVDSLVSAFGSVASAPPFIPGGRSNSLASALKFLLRGPCTADSIDALQRLLIKLSSRVSAQQAGTSVDIDQLITSIEQKIEDCLNGTGQCTPSFIDAVRDRVQILERKIADLKAKQQAGNLKGNAVAVGRQIIRLEEEVQRLKDILAKC